MSNEERHIINERNTTAIVREHDPNMVERWDRDLVRLSGEHKTQMRVAAIGIAVNVLNSDPNLYSRIRDLVSKDADTNVENIPEFFYEHVAPMADRVYDYITQDSN